MITFILMAMSFVIGFVVGSYGFYKRILRHTEDIYLVASADIFSILKKQGYRIVKVGAECDDNR